MCRMPAYPNLDTICRLCLEENAGVVDIFSKHDANGNNISIPMRLMVCATLEVQNGGDMPKKICTSCRFELEKAYYFRKRSQASDAKLRKHFRLLSMGKESRVFVKNDEDDDDELELKDSIDFIRARENEKAKLEEQAFASFKQQVQLESEEYIKTMKVTLELEIAERLKTELIPVLRKKLKDECLEEAKRLVYNEVRDECRDKEAKRLLMELEDFFHYKRKQLQLESSIKGSSKENENYKIADSERQSVEKVRIFYPKGSELVSSGDNLGMDDRIVNIRTVDNTVKNTALKVIEQNDSGPNDKELVCVIYNKMDNALLNMDQDSNTSSTSSSNGCELMEINGKLSISEGEEDSIDKFRTSTISYQIRDDDNGEITFLKTSLKGAIDEKRESNIMLMDFVEDIDNLNLVEIGERKEDVATTSGTVATAHSTVLSTTFSNFKQRTTDTAKTFQCSECPMKFSMQKALERHIRTHRKSQQTGVTYECPECRCVLSCSSALRRHMNVHADRKPFECGECGKAFVQKEILKRHSLTHTGVKPHQCPQCGKSFAQRINLTQHINRHHAEEPHVDQYNCPLCPKRFFHASGLSRHLASHSGVAYRCTECERMFGDRSSVRRHIANMHGKGTISKTNINS